MLISIEVWQYELIPNHNGCMENSERIGHIGKPKDFLSNVSSPCLTGDAVCLDLGLEACDKTLSCEGFSIYSGVHPNMHNSVIMYNSTAYNESNPCGYNTKYGLSYNSLWNMYKKISYGKNLLKNRRFY